MTFGEMLEEWKTKVKLSFEECPWIDFLGHVVQIQKNAIDKILKYIQNEEDTEEVVGCY